MKMTHENSPNPSLKKKCALNSAALHAQGCYTFVFPNRTHVQFIFIVFMSMLALLTTHGRLLSPIVFNLKISLMLLFQQINDSSICICDSESLSYLQTIHLAAYWTFPPMGLKHTSNISKLSHVVCRDMWSPLSS